jgi:rhodanese-related sulfurtransferase
MTPGTGSAKKSRASLDLTSLAWPASLIVALSLVSALAAHHFRGEPLPGDWRPGASAAGITLLDDLDELDRLVGDPAVIVVDARDERLYRLGHIPGAKSLPADRASALAAPFLAGIPEDSTFLIYCSEPLCPLAERLAIVFQELGRDRLLVFRPGFDAWRGSGRPTSATPGVGS